MIAKAVSSHVRKVLETTRAACAGRVEVALIEGADHALRAKAVGSVEREVVEATDFALRSFIGEVGYLSAIALWKHELMLFHLL